MEKKFYYSEKFKDKVVVITGASRGIGYAVAKAFAFNKARVYMLARNRENLQKAVVSLKEKGQKYPVGMKVDISIPSQIKRVFENIIKKENTIDILINNAGIGVFKPFSETTLQDFEKVFNINVRGTFLCCKYAFEIMKKNKKGWIVNVGSIVSIKGYPNQSVYTASKHAVLGLTKVLSEEGKAYNIKVLSVCPGGVTTDMAKELINTIRPDIIPETLMKPEDIANTILFMIGFSDTAVIDNIILRRTKSSSNF